MSRQSRLPAYDQTWFAPPAPLAHVAVRNPNRGTAVANVPMLLDSGADITLVPAGVAASLGLAAIPGREYELIGFGGSISRARVVRLELAFGRRTFRGQFALIDQVWGILGRNVHNTRALLFDGPNLTWHEMAPGRPANPL